MPKEKKTPDIKLETNKTAKASSTVFHNIMKASMTNLKPVPKKKVVKRK